MIDPSEFLKSSWILIVVWIFSAGVLYASITKDIDNLTRRLDVLEESLIFLYKKGVDR